MDIITININLDYDFPIQILFINKLHLCLLKTYKDKEIIYTFDKNTNPDNATTLSIFGVFTGSDKKNYLNDKIMFYHFLTNNSFLLKNVKLIPTYTEQVKIDTKNKFIIKPKNALGSEGIIIIEDHLNTILNKYNPADYQIQDLIIPEFEYYVNCCCDNGYIINTLSAKTKKLNMNGNNERNVSNYVDIIPINNFIINIVKKLNYTGFIGFDFLIDGDNYYIMECNPRITGMIFSEIYYDEIIIPYLIYKEKGSFIKNNSRNEDITVNFNSVSNVIDIYSKLFLSLFIK